MPLSYTLAGDATCCSHLKIIWSFLTKTICTHTHTPYDLLFFICYPREVKTYLHTKGSIYNHEKLKTSQIPISWCVAKQIVEYPYSGTLLSHTRNHAADVCRGIDEPQNRYAKGRNPDTKCYVLHESICYENLK